MNNRLLLNGSDWVLTGLNPNQWRLDTSMELNTRMFPAIPPLSATVPGAIQLDLFQEGVLPDYRLGQQSMAYEWVNNRDWILQKCFIVPKDLAGDQFELVFEGIDDKGEIWLNDHMLTRFEGMFTPIRLDVTRYLKFSAAEKNELKVVIEPSESVYGQFGYSSKITKLKSRFNYGWDWCPRIVPSGIWRDVYLQATHVVSIEDFDPHTTVQDNLQQGDMDIRASVQIRKDGKYTFEFQVEDDRGTTVAHQIAEHMLDRGHEIIQQSISLKAVGLWWPHGVGDQPLYKVSLTILDAQNIECDHHCKTVGFRHCEFKRSPQAPPDSLPYTAYINGRRIFLKGINWVPVTPFYGAVSAEQYAQHLDPLLEMNINMIRIWGGGITESEDFYRYCDEKGILVWQEFLQSSSGIDNCPPSDEAFIQHLKEVSKSAILEKRHHPSLVVWCGGNELMWDGYIPVDESHPNIDMLSKLVSKLDPDKLFLPASASGPTFCDAEEQFGQGVHHDVHGPWDFLGDIDHYRFFNHNDALIRTESGTPGMARMESLHQYAEDQTLWPPTHQNAYWLHRGSFWLQWEQLSKLFGPWDKEHDEMFAYNQASRYLQMESLRYMIESGRRREPELSGFLIWMGNEPFPNHTNTSVIEYDGIPKPAYYAAQRAFSNRHVSARYERIAYQTGDLFHADLYIHHESFAKGDESVNVSASIIAADGKLLALKQFPFSAKENAEHLGSIEWKVAPIQHQLFILRLDILNQQGDIRPEARNDYIFTVDTDYPFAPLRQMPKALLRKNIYEQQLSVVNESEVIAIGVFAILKPNQKINISNNYAMILPGESHHFQISQKASKFISIESFNGEMI